MPEDNIDTIGMIKYFKRKDEAKPTIIGPWKNITPFEAANRIASDLVILNGILELVNKNKELQNALFTVILGATHVQKKGDFTIKFKNTEIEGEAFNVVPTFLKDKLYQTNHKWKKEGMPKLSYILINADAYEGKTPNDERIFLVKKWDNLI